ncbi:MAG: ABC transporter permease, partial [Candidatus Hydrogenedentes bacterium]|nr:ABC transporter permease [Candidatus Hydrogenedentota bacterium]
MHLPLAHLELTRAARHKSIHWLRFVAPTVCGAALLLAWFFMSMGGSTLYETVNIAGSFLTNTVFGFLLFTVCVLTPLFASSTIAAEKQERSLGLLLLTNIRGRDLFIAKALTVFLQVELLVLGCLPLQAIASFLGGLSLQMLIGQQIAAASLCLVVASLGLLCSSFASR